MNYIDDAVVIETLGACFRANYAVLPAVGTRGGVLIVVHEDYYKTQQIEVQNHSVSAKLQATTGLAEWWITVVYGPQEENSKVQFLQDLHVFRQNFPGRWLVIGDFNMILQAQDKSNTNINRRLMGVFRNWANDLQL